MSALRSKGLRSVGAVLLALGLQAAWADSPTVGQALYGTHCASCHGASPLTSNTSKIFNGRNARSVTDAAITSVGEMNALRPSFPAGGTALADLAAYLGNTPTSLSFGSTAVGATSAALTVTVYASLKSGKAIASLVVSTSGEFARSGGTCGTAVATGASCTVAVTFTPAASGVRSGSLSISHSQTLSPIAIALSGTGSAPAGAPAAAITPSTLSFASTAIGSTSAAQNVNVGNTGNAPLALSAISLSNPADFTIAGGTCSAGGSVAAGSSCTVSVAFRPGSGAAGARSGSLSIAHNATGSPGTVALGGTAAAAAAPVAALSGPLNFGSVNVGVTSAVQTATLSNSGNAALAIGSITSGSSEFVVSGGSCAAGGAVAAGASCTVNVTLTPAAAGARAATLIVTHNAGGGQSTSSLAGTGVALTPAIVVSPSALSFNQPVATVSTAQTVTVSNSGTAPLLLGSLSLGGAQAADFQFAAGSTCAAGGSVAASSSCSVRIAFAPAAAGARSASLSITHNAGGSPASVALDGTGTATAQPAVSLDASTLTFGAQVVASASASQSVTVSNAGAAPLVFSGITISGTAAADFTRSGSCSPSGTLAVGASCTLSLSFTPAAAGTRTATLTLASNASNGSAVLSLAGTGVAAVTTGITLSPAALAFGNQTVASTSAPRSVILSSSGTGALSLGAITASAGFTVSHNCGGSVASAGSCTLSVSFTPPAVGTLAGTLSVVSNAAGSPHTVALTGSGVTTAPVLAWSPALGTLDFGSVAVGGVPASRSLNLLNQGPGPVTLSQLTLAGPQAADFALAAGGSCVAGATLAANATCTLTLGFQPGAIGPRTGSLQVTGSGTNPPDLSLAGTGTAVTQPGASVSPNSLSFVTPAGATSVEAQLLTLKSTGAAVLRVTALRVAAGPFTLQGTGTACATPPFDLMPGQFCELAVGWSDPGNGAQAGAVEITTNASATPMSVAVQANREAAPAMANVGAGGCSLARGDTLADPTLLALAVLAAAVLWRRRGARLQRDAARQTGS